MRDLTRGGLATVLNELAKHDGAGVLLEEELIPVREEVRSICELLGLDPLYLACEGRLAAVVDADSEDHVVGAMRALPDGEESRCIGRISEEYAGKVALQTRLGTHRLLQMLSGEQLPRIC
jgi:hydrogenase expression/formation protein HypE